MPKKRLVSSAGRYGSRYGRRIRKRVIAVDKTKNKKYVCKHCLKPGLKRESSGIWLCNKCSSKYAGKAYKP